MKASLLLISLLYLAGTESVMVCYYGSWSTYRNGVAEFEIEDIDPFICTHLVYGFAGISANTSEIVVLDPYYELADDWGLFAYDRFTGLKNQNPALITTLAVGGWNEGSEKYSLMAADPSRRAAFISSTMALLNAHDFDGLDMDWEYPGSRGGVPEDKQNYVILLQELGAALHAEGKILTAAVSAGKTTIDDAYDIPAVSAALDYIHVMAYDLHGSWDPYTDHHTLTDVYPGDTEENKILNVKYALNYWLDNGAESNKLVLGTAAYGRTFTLASTADTGMYAVANGPGAAGEYIPGESGFMGYNEICKKQLDYPNDWDVVHDPDMLEPYAIYGTSGNQWVGYEDVASISLKGELARDFGIAGVMIWSIETDDFRAACNAGAYPLIKNVYAAFGGSIPTAPTTPTPDPNATTLKTTTTIIVDPGDICQGSGNVPDPEDCTHFYECVPRADGSGYDAVSQDCGAGTLYDSTSQVCDWPINVCNAEDPTVCPNDC